VGGKFNLPPWFLEQFPARYTARDPFSSKLSKNFGLQPLPETPEGILVSVPKRALLEMLSEVGVHQGIEEARNIMEGARSLRPEVLATLLKHCQRVKVVRLCLSWSQELNLPKSADSIGVSEGTVPKTVPTSQVQPDLAEVVAAWHSLSEPLKAAVLAIVHTATGGASKIVSSRRAGFRPNSVSSFPVQGGQTPKRCCGMS